MYPHIYPHKAKVPFRELWLNPAKNRQGVPPHMLGFWFVIIGVNPRSQFW
jgi:hypothetical protein